MAYLTRLLILLVMMLGMPGIAGAVTFSGGAVSDCTFTSSNNTYTCASAFNSAQDLTIASGYKVQLASSLTLAWAQRLTMSGTAQLSVSGNLNIGSAQQGYLSISGGSLVSTGSFSMSSQVHNITANINASSMSFQDGAKVTGTLTASGQISLPNSTVITGDINAGSLTTGMSVGVTGKIITSGQVTLGNNTVISGDMNAASMTLGSYVGVTGKMTASGQVTIGNNSVISGDISAASMSLNSNTRVTGKMTATGHIFVGSSSIITGDINSATMKIEADSQVNGTLTATGLIDLASRTVISSNISGGQVTTNSSVQLKGNVSATGEVYIGSASKVNGNISGSKVSTDSGVTLTGDVTGTQSFNLGSGSVMTGNVVAPVVALLPSSVRINGNVTASTSLTLSSASSVVGNVNAGAVRLDSSEAYIDGDATVNSIFLDWHGRVKKTIYCKTPAPDNLCSCVTNNSGYTVPSDPNSPKCLASPSPATSVHHYQITHDGTGLTCQPETVSVKACADASCSTLYNGSAQVTLKPNNVESTLPAFSVSNAGAGSSAYVRSTVAGTFSLSIDSATPAATGSTVCVNGAGSSCQMTFADKGFTVTSGDHKAGTSRAFTVEAKQADAGNPASTCVPLFANSDKSIAMRCGYIDPTTNPSTASQKLKLTATGTLATGALVCGSGDATSAAGAAPVNLSLRFNGNGLANGTLVYDDVGKLTLSADYTVSAPASSPANVIGSSAPFLVTPDHFAVDTIAVGTTAAPGTANPGWPSPANAVFNKAGTPFGAVVTALSANNVVTANFGRESTPGTVTLAHTLIDPAPSAGGVAGTLGTPTLAPGTTAGKYNANGLTWNEVGVITLTATLFTGTNAGLYASLPTSLTGSGTSANIGRFTPDHFDTALTAGDLAPMTCPGGFPIACVGSRFVYAGQPVQLTVSAMSGGSAPSITRNYKGSYALPTTITAWNAAGASGAANSNPEYRPMDSAPRSIPTGEGGPTVATAIAYTSGVGLGSVKYDFSKNYASAAVLTAVSRPVNVYFRATDTDSVTSLRTGAAEAGIGVASGRLVVGNAYGSELLRQRVPVSAEYWTGTVFQRNLADATQGTTTLTSSNVVTYSNCTKNLAASGANGCYAGLSVYSTPDKLKLEYGASWLRLNAPGAGRNGTVQVRVNAFPWLPSTAGSITYGIYRSPLTYMREVY